MMMIIKVMVVVEYLVKMATDLFVVFSYVAVLVSHYSIPVILHLSHGKDFVGLLSRPIIVPCL